ncbi:MAG: hypothetical protein AAF713_02190 [Pseudomonadota bacterium]
MIAKIHPVTAARAEHSHYLEDDQAYLRADARPIMRVAPSAQQPERGDHRDD